MSEAFNRTDSDTQIITPGFWGSFRLTAGAGQAAAIYHPAINQIWMDDKLSRNEREIAYLHEGTHALTMCFQTPQLLALQAELTGTAYLLPSGKHFEDLVEVVCATYFLVHTGLEITPRYLVETDPQRHRLGAELIEIAEGIAQKATRKISPEKAVREALAGLCTLIMHIIPYRTNLGPAILKMMRSIPIPEYWEDQWQVFYHFYSELQKLRLNSTRKLRQFDLNLVPDAHRDLLDMCVNLARTICSVPTRAVAVTATFPTILMVLTMRCFRFVPILYLRTAGLQNEVDIDVDHVSHRSLKNMTEAVSKQQEILRESEAKNQPCHAAKLFITIAEKTRPFITSSAKDRSVCCFRLLLDTVPSQLKRLMNAQRICPRCGVFRTTPMVLWAYNMIITMPKRIRTKLLDAVENYESWLKSGGMKVVRDERGLAQTPKAIVKYRFL